MKNKRQTGVPKLNVFQANAAELRRLKEAAEAAWLRRGEGDQQRQVWHQALERFHSAYGDLAFPGGWENASFLCGKNDPQGIEMAVRFLEADPWFFRSGYIKADLLRLLRTAPLTEEQRQRLRQVVIARVDSQHTPREFRWYCRLARVISDLDFERQVAGPAEQRRTIRGQHACWVLAQIRAARRSSVKQ